MNLINSGAARYRIRFDSNCVEPAALAAGLSFLLLMVYYFGAVDFGVLNAMEVIFCMFLPLLLTAGFMVLLRGLRYPLVPAYGVIGCLLCLVLIVRTCLVGSTLNIVFAFIWYIPTALLCLGTTLSYLTNPYLMAAAFLVAAVVRFITTDVFGYLLKLDILGFLPSVATTFALVAFGVFAFTLKLHVPKRKK